MKKVLIIATGALLTFGFTSCKKDYTCECTSTSTSSSTDPDLQSILPAPSTTTSSLSKSMKKKESEDWCKGFESESTYNSGGGFFNYTVTDKTTCELK